VVAVIFTLLILMGTGFMQHVSVHTQKIKGQVPLQENMRTAFEAVQKDLMSASRSSLGNLIFDGGFEAVPPVISTAPDTLSQNWRVPFQILNPLDPTQNAWVRPVNLSGLGTVFRGKSALYIGHGGGGYSVKTPVFQLTDGMTYMAGLWARARNASANAPIMRVWGGLTNPPSAVIASSATASVAWGPLRCSFTAVGSYFYQLELAVGAGAVEAGFFDDVALSPMSVELTAGSGRSFSFDRFDPETGARQKIRYRVDPWQGTGRLVRETASAGKPWQPLGAPFNDVTKVVFSWKGGGADILTKGTDRAMEVRMEVSGPSGLAGKDMTIFMETDVYSPVP